MGSANAVDRLVGFFNPGAGLRRVIARQLLQRAYEAASPRDTWRPRRAGASPQADHFADANILRAKARALVQNVPYIAASMDALVANVVGTGIVPRFTGDQAKKLQDIFAQWAPVCDADGQLDFFGMQAAAYRAMEQDGEVLIRLRPRRLDDGLPVPLQLQLLEIDWLDHTKNTPTAGGGGAAAGNMIIEGIEYDQLGRVFGYWIWDRHPGDLHTLTGFRSFSKRVPAASIIHLFDPKRPGQRRGITKLAAIIARTRDMQLYEDAELARKNLETRLSVFVSGDAADMANPNQVGGSTSGRADPSYARSSGELGELPSGAMTELPAGTQVTTLEPKPAGGLVEYLTYNLHIVTALLGVTYEMATGDMSQVNFSSARVRQQDVRRGFEHTQWLILIPRMAGPLATAFAETAKLAGKIPMGAKYGVEHDPPAWDYVNPLQEAQGDAMQIANGLGSISGKLRAKGLNADKVFDELASDFAKLKEKGVLDILLFLQKGTLRVTDQSGDPSTAGDAVAKK
jgi:lambda family phage portal protein